jgi:pilus assembly protein CpaB
MKKRLISVFAFALAVSAGAAFVLYQLISSKVTAGAANHPVTKTVFIASRDLEPGTLVTEHDIAKQEYITIPDGAITRKEEILNRGVVSAIHRDTPFFEGTLAGQGAGGGFATIIPKGMRALAVRVNEVVGVAGFAVAGMHVDVLVAGMPPGSGHEAAGAISRTLLQNISVLSAGQNYQKDAEGKPVLVQVVNLLVTPAQAEILNLATDQRIQLVLRNPTDQEITQTPGAATINLFEGTAIRTSRVAFSASSPGPRPFVAGGAAGTAGASGARAGTGSPAPPPAVTQAPRRPQIEVISGTNRTQIIFGRVVEKDAAEIAK